MAHVSVIKKGERVMGTTFGAELDYISLIGSNIRPTEAQEKARQKKVNAVIQSMGKKHCLAIPVRKIKHG